MKSRWRAAQRPAKIAVAVSVVYWGLFLGVLVAGPFVSWVLEQGG